MDASGLRRSFLVFVTGTHRSHAPTPRGPGLIHRTYGLTKQKGLMVADYPRLLRVFRKPVRVGRSGKRRWEDESRHRVEEVEGGGRGHWSRGGGGVLEVGKGPKQFSPRNRPCPPRGFGMSDPQNCKTTKSVLC